jgi:hypothetical protein
VALPLRRNRLEVEFPVIAEPHGIRADPNPVPQKLILVNTLFTTPGELCACRRS